MAQLFSLGHITHMKTVLPHFVWLVGLFIFLYGWLSFPDVPLNAVPSDMRNAYHIQLVVGILIFLQGVTWVFARLLIRLFCD